MIGREISRAREPNTVPEHGTVTQYDPHTDTYTIRYDDNELTETISEAALRECLLPDDGMQTEPGDDSQPYIPSEPPVDRDANPLAGNITQEELLTALHFAKNNKAAGLDGIFVEFWKQGLERTLHDSCEAVKNWETENPMMLFLWKAINHVFLSKDPAPEHIRTAILMYVFKKGDPKDMANYRGLHFDTAIAKLISIVLLRRMTKYALKEKNLTPEQGGASGKHRCPAHTAAMREMIERRWHAGCDTYTIFIDLKKAYDMVRHDVLLAKLRAFGYDGLIYDYIERMLTHAAVSIHGTSVPLRMGIRQGDPMSGFLFNIYMSDILDNIPGVIAVGGFTLRGVMFVDDVTMLCADIESVNQALRALENWLGTTHMRAGHSKSGIMRIVGKGRTLPPLQDDDFYKVAGESMPIIDGLPNGNPPRHLRDTDYCHLGSLMRPLLKGIFDIVAQAQHRARKGYRLWRKYRRQFACIHTVSIATKRTIYMTIIATTTLFGGGALVFNPDAIAVAEDIRGKCLRSMIGVNQDSTCTTTAVIGRELGISTAKDHAYLEGARQILCYEGTPTLSESPLSRAIRTLPEEQPNSSSTHLHRVYADIRRRAPPTNTIALFFQIEGRLKKLRGPLEHESWVTACKDSKTAQIYDERMYVRHREFITVNVPSHHFLGVTRLIQLRVQALSKEFAPHQVHCKRLVSKLCPCCGQARDEPRHLLLDCPTHADARQQHLQGLINATHSLLGTSNRKHTYTLITGGAVIGKRGRNGLDTFIEIENWSSVQFLLVADFLAQTLPVHKRALKAAMRAYAADIEIPVPPQHPESANAIRGLVQQMQQQEPAIAKVLSAAQWTTRIYATIDFKEGAPPRRRYPDDAFEERLAAFAKKAAKSRGPPKDNIGPAATEPIEVYLRRSDVWASLSKGKGKAGKAASAVTQQTLPAPTDALLLSIHNNDHEAMSAHIEAFNTTTINKTVKGSVDTPLTYACRRGNSTAVEALLFEKARPDVTNKNQLTPLQEAAIAGYIECVRQLLHHPHTIILPAHDIKSVQTTLRQYPAHSLDTDDRRQTILGMVQARQAEVELHNLFDSRVIQYDDKWLDRIEKLTRTPRIDLERKDRRGRTLAEHAANKGFHTAATALSSIHPNPLAPRSVKCDYCDRTQLVTPHRSADGISHICFSCTSRGTLGPAPTAHQDVDDADDYDDDDDGL